MINWQLSKQGIRWPVSPDRTAGSRVHPSRSSIFLTLSVVQMMAGSSLFFQWFIWNMLCLCHYGPALLRFWLQTDLGRENSASFFKNSGGDDLFLPWTRVGNALRPIFMLWLVKIAAGSTSENAIVKVLGSIWNTDTDQFTFDLLDLSQHASLLPTMKRSLLKISAKIFDPLGLLSPSTL